MICYAVFVMLGGVDLAVEGANTTCEVSLEAAVMVVSTRWGRSNWEGPSLIKAEDPVMLVVVSLPSHSEGLGVVRKRSQDRVYP